MITDWKNVLGVLCARRPVHPMQSLLNRQRIQMIRYSPGERYAATYEINLMRCIYCGFCEDACPTEAIVLEHEYELAYLDRGEALFTKVKLLDPVSKSQKATPQKVEPGIFTRSIPEMKNPV